MTTERPGQEENGVQEQKKWSVSEIKQKKDYAYIPLHADGTDIQAEGIEER